MTEKAQTVFRKMKKVDLPKMELTTNSSSVKATVYLPDKEEYFVEFTNGDVYVYTKVSQLIADQLKIYDSIGQGVARLLRAAPKLHPVEKIQFES